MSSETPLITVVTPTLNAGRYLKAMLDSVWNHRPPDIGVEHIIVDGGSTDDTLAIADGFPSTVVAETDGGMYEAVNKGLERARGVIFGYVNSDDEITPAAFRAIADGFARSSARWLVAPMVHIDESNNVLGTLKPPRWLSPARYRALGWNCFPQPSTYFRTAFARELGGFSGDYRLASDYDFCARALDRERPLYVELPLSRFRLHGTNLGKLGAAKMAAEADAIAHAMQLPRWQRRALRLLTKIQINAQNLDWAIGKRTGRIPY